MLFSSACDTNCLLVFSVRRQTMFKVAKIFVAKKVMYLLDHCLQICYLKPGYRSRWTLSGLASARRRGNHPWCLSLARYVQPIYEIYLRNKLTWEKVRTCCWGHFHMEYDALCNPDWNIPAYFGSLTRKKTKQCN